MVNNFTDVFGGSPVQPSEVAYRSINLTTTNTQLYWPFQSIDTADIIARWNDVTPSAGSQRILFPSAAVVSLGQDATFNNVGSDTFSVLDGTGGLITTVAPGVVKYIINTGNSTSAGNWDVTTFGTGTSAADASTLAGHGLKAITTKLNVNFPVSDKGGDYLIDDTDRAIVFNLLGGASTFTLPDPAVVGAGWFCGIRNSGSGALTLDSGAALVDSATTKTYNQGESSWVICNGGVHFNTIGFGQLSTNVFTRLSVSVAGAADVNLTQAQSANQVLEFTGALTGDISVTVPQHVAEYFVYNATTGAHTLTFKAFGGTGEVIVQGTRRITNCDGTNVFFSDDATGAVTQVSTGSGLTGGPITTTGTISFATIASHAVLANITGGAAVPSANTLSNIIDAAIGSTQGQILYRGGSNWSALGTGTAGRYLGTGGAADDPAWTPIHRVLVGLANSTQALNNGSETIIAWDSATWDNDSFWAGGNPTRITIPSGVTKVLIRAGLKATGTTTAISLYVKNNTAQTVTGLPQIDTKGGVDNCVSIAGSCVVAPGDILTLCCNITGAGVTAGQYQTFMAVDQLIAQ